MMTKLHSEVQRAMVAEKVGITTFYTTTHAVFVDEEAFIFRASKEEAQEAADKVKNHIEPERVQVREIQ